MSTLKKRLPTPTEAQFMNLKQAYEYFNQALFEGILPSCILNFSRKKNTHGFLAPYRWRERNKKEYSTHEISLTPTTLYREPKEVFSTLVHEQCHLWQFEFGKPSRNGYHNREWARKMIEVGLMPSSTGKVGGKQTGQGMTHYIIEEGAYEQAFEAMPPELALPFISREADEMKLHTTEGNAGKKSSSVEKKNSKTKYSCSCGNNVWGKPHLHIRCDDCGELFTMC